MGVSQPSLTKCLQRLESEFNTQLFQRSSKGLKLTSAGTKLQSEAQRLLVDFENLRSRILNSEQKIEGILKIGCHASVALYSLPHLLPSLMHENSDLNIALEHDLSRKITEAVISSRLDVGLVINPLAHPDLIIKKVAVDQVGFWQSTLSAKDVLLADLELAQTQSLLKKSKKGSSQYHRIVSCPNLEVIAELVAAGVGQGVLPSRVAKRSQRKLKLVPNTPTFLDELCLVYRVENRNSKKIKAFCDKVISALKD